MKKEGLLALLTDLGFPKKDIAELILIFEKEGFSQGFKKILHQKSKVLDTEDLEKLKKLTIEIDDNQKTKDELIKETVVEVIANAKKLAKEDLAEYKKQEAELQKIDAEYEFEMRSLNAQLDEDFASKEKLFEVRLLSRYKSKLN